MFRLSEQTELVCVPVWMPEQERKGQLCAWGTGRGQVTCVILETRIHYLGCHSLEKGHNFILFCSKMLSRKYFSENII